MLTKLQLQEIMRDWNFWEQKIDPDKVGWRREIYLEKITKYLKRREIIVLKGVRRGGKSTLMFQLMDWVLQKNSVKDKQLFYLNLEDFRLSNDLNIDLLEEFLSLYRETINPQLHAYLFLDEIQNVPQWEKWIRTHYDQDRNMKFVISGSSSVLLSQELSTLLTGRNLSFTVFPFSFAEYIRYQGITIAFADNITNFYLNNKTNKSLIKNYFNKYMNFGGFPEVIKETDDDKKETLLAQYFEDIIYKDVAFRYKLREVKNIFDIATYSASNISQPLSINNIAKTLRLSPNTVSDILEFLQSAFLFTCAQFFSYSLKTSLDRQKPRKIYALDNGFIKVASVNFSKNTGAKFENLAAQKTNQTYNTLFYWQEKKEVDFVVRSKDKKLLPINVTFDDQIKDREKQGILEFCKKFKQKQGIILTDDLLDEEIINKVKINYYPLYLYLLWE